MLSLNNPESTKWVVAHNNKDIFHFSIVEPQHCFNTGQPYIDVFDSAAELLIAYPQLSAEIFTDATSLNFID